MAAIRKWFGIEIDEVSRREKTISVVGGAIAGGAVAIGVIAIGVVIAAITRALDIVGGPTRDQTATHTDAAANLTRRRDR